jgi:hypothetical protein
MDALVGERFDNVGAELYRFEQTQSHDRHHNVQLEVAGLSAQG